MADLPHASEAFLRRLLDDIDDEPLLRSWGEDLDIDELREDLISWGAADPEIAHDVMMAWRRQHASMVRSVGGVYPEDLGAHARDLVLTYDLEPLLLMLLTDPDGDQRTSAEGFIAALTDRGLEKGAQRLLARWGWSDDPIPDGPRVLIVGGHPREEGRRYADITDRCTVIWQSFVRGKGRHGWQKRVARFRVDGMIIISGRVSHSVMEGARRAAESALIPFRCIAAATRQQLSRSLAELFEKGADSAPSPGE